MLCLAHRHCHCCPSRLRLAAYEATIGTNPSKAETFLHQAITAADSVLLQQRHAAQQVSIGQVHCL
jgi:hypothetical protein